MCQSNFTTLRVVLAGLVLVLLTLDGKVQAGNPWDTIALGRSLSLPKPSLPDVRHFSAPPQFSVRPQFPQQAAAAVAPPAAQPARVAAAATIVQYQVEYRHAAETANQWRVAVAWNSDYTYARGVYDRMVGYQTYDVRLYKRNR
jgi:hypothetical protein